ncbi:MAG TPA: hypothetical protein PKY08_03610, partial [Candidatus Magasanikbacteria bacterium]|nr:hypothetical protein [Candidatus Magasanikbacteria bacterium]
LNLSKNEMWQNILLDFFPIFWYELKKFVYYLFCQPSVLKAWSDLKKNHSELKDKRRTIQHRKKINWQDFRKWLKK